MQRSEIETTFSVLQTILSFMLRRLKSGQIYIGTLQGSYNLALDDFVLGICIFEGLKE